MLLSAVSVLVVAQKSSEIPEGLMNNPVLGEKNGITEHNKGNQTIPEKVATTRTEDGHK